MAEIIPALLPHNFPELKEKFGIVSGHTTIVHLDISDSSLTPHSNWPYSNTSDHWDKIKNEEVAFPYWEEFNFEAHLMVKDVEAVYEDWIRAGAERLIVHYEAFESDESLTDFLLKFHEHFSGENSHLKIEIGLAVNFETEISKILPHVIESDFIHLMSISNLGEQGGEFREEIFDKIKELRSAYPETIVSVDGGVNMENVERLVEAGVERLVVGSAIFSAPIPQDALEDLIIEAE